MPIIETEFDGLLEDDIVFEETEEVLKYKDLLKNAENMYKSILYLKKLMSSGNPFINNIIKMNSVSNSEKTTYSIDVKTGLIVLKNTSELDSAEIFLDGGKFLLFPFESIEFPITSSRMLELKGDFSMIESEYNS